MDKKKYRVVIKVKLGSKKYGVNIKIKGLYENMAGWTIGVGKKKKVVIERSWKKEK